MAAVQKLHAAFTDLAAKYQGLHQALAVQKASYRQLHRSVHGTAPVFEAKEALKKPTQAAPLPSLSGPSPFSAPTDPLVQARNSLLSRLNMISHVECHLFCLFFICFLPFQEPSWSPHFATGHSCSNSYFWEPWICGFFRSPSVCLCFWRWQHHFWLTSWWICQPIQHHIRSWQLNNRSIWGQHKFRRWIWSQFNFRSSQPDCWEQKEQTLNQKTSAVKIAMIDVDRAYLLKITLNTFLPGIIL